MELKFKTEIFLLSTAIVMFIVSAYFYLYQSGSFANESLGLIPYRFYAFSLIGTGSVLTVVATFSYTKRSKK